MFDRIEKYLNEHWLKVCIIACVTSILLAIAGNLYLHYCVPESTALAIVIILLLFVIISQAMFNYLEFGSIFKFKEK